MKVLIIFFIIWFLCNFSRCFVVWKLIVLLFVVFVWLLINLNEWFKFLVWVLSKLGKLLSLYFWLFLIFVICIVFDNILLKGVFFEIFGDVGCMDEILSLGSEFVFILLFSCGFVLLFFFFIKCIFIVYI